MIFIRKPTRAEEAMHTIDFPSRLSKFNLGKDCLPLLNFPRQMEHLKATECSKQNKSQVVELCW